MAILTIADLDNGKRDLETVDAVANSRAASATTRLGQQTTTLYESIRRINATGDSILRNLGYFVPVAYAPGISVTEPNFTVIGPDGNIYAAQPGQIPFTTGTWNQSQWYPIQNELNDRKLLVFDTPLEAESAAATLPDGTNIVVSGQTQGQVTSGTYAPDSGTPADRLQNYQDLAGYSGKSEALDITGEGVAGRFYRRGEALSNGGTVIKDALGRSWEREYSGAVNVKWFGAKGNFDGLTGDDDTDAIKAAAKASDFIFLPPGRYKLSDELPNVGTSALYVGAGMNCTELVQTALGKKIFSFTGQWGGFRDLSLDYSGTPSVGATAVYSTSANLSAQNFHIKRCHIGIEVTIGPAQLFKQFFIDNYAHVGIFAHKNNDCYFANFILDAKNSTNGALGGIRLFNKSEAMFFSSGSVLNGVYSLTTDADSYTEGFRPAYNKFTSIYFDSASLGCDIDKMVESAFIGAWFSGGRSGAGLPGCTLLQTDSISFSAGSSFFNCGGHGLHIRNASARTSVSDSYFESNSISSGPGVSHGVFLEQGTSDFMLTGNFCRNGLYSGGQQGFGIYIATGSSARYIVKNNNLGGNAIGGMFDGGAGSLARVADNIGYNPVGLTVVTVGPSPFVYFAGNTRETLYISGGTVDGLNMPGGAILGPGTERVIPLEPGEEVAVFYTAPPTIHSFRH